MKRTQGITLIVLVITVVVLMIISGVVVYNGISEIEQANENKALSEVQIVQQAVLEAYTNYSKTKNEKFLVGTVVEEGKMAELATELGVTLATIPDDYADTVKSYYRLSPLTLEEIGIYESQDTYIVNYLTGEVINETLKKTKSGKPLYAYSVKSFTNDDVTAF